jgi:hypothetical protein
MKPKGAGVIMAQLAGELREGLLKQAVQPIKSEKEKEGLKSGS